MKASFAHLDRFRVSTSPPGKRYGAFQIPLKGSREILMVIADDGTGADGGPDEVVTGWEHVSARVVVDPVFDINRVPTWYEMCYLKDLFWDEAEVVLQYHIDGKAKINVRASVLHLWRPCDGQFPLPDPGMVG
jgi:hypothetical protein